MATQTTTDGYPWPDGTEKVRDGDDAIRALAEALTGRTFTTLAKDQFKASDPASAFNRRPTVMPVTTAGGWPGMSGGNTGVVITIASSSDPVTWQLLAVGTTRVAMYQRTGYGSTWSPWAGPGAFAEAAGQLTGPTVQNGDTATFTITFPSGRFTKAPVLAAVRGHTRLAYGGMPSSASSVTITAANYSGGAAGAGPVQWHAVQMTEESGVGLLELGDPVAPAVARCTTRGCENFGIGIDIDLGYVDEDGNAQQVDPANVYCGVCGNPCHVTTEEAS